MDWCFSPPESYDDAWLEKIWEVFEFVKAQPCTCTEDDDPWDACRRCFVLNREHDKYVGRGR